MDIIWRLRPFDELTPYEMYDLLRLRSEVFVVEQACVYLDMDGKDDKSHHLSGYVEGVLAAYTRLLPPGLSYDEMSIGRVVTAQDMRKSGLGKALMQRSIGGCEELWGEGPIRIGAQLYLQRFYESFGFLQASDSYLEDGIEHIEMLRTHPRSVPHLRSAYGTPAPPQPS